MLERVRRFKKAVRSLILGGLTLCAVALILFAMLVWYVSYSPRRWRFSTEIAEAERAQVFVKEYRLRNGELPREQEVPQGRNEGQIFFQPREDGSYVVGFIVGFDEWYELDSRTGKWSFEK